MSANPILRITSKSLLLLAICLFCVMLSAQIKITPVIQCEDFIVSSTVSEADGVPVAPVWSGHPVAYDILTDGADQYVVYYDTARVMTVAHRKLPQTEWTYSPLPSVTGWDTHNSVKIAMDKRGYLHISGNMHNVPLIYFRSQKPRDITIFEALPMAGEQEERVTYPVFFKNKADDLFFQFRNGGSGNGVTYWNAYDAETQQWSRLLPAGLFDGEGETNAYPQGPVLGPDGYFHVSWVWRETPVANTNHNLSYMRSKDLVHWETAGGHPVELPVKRQMHALIADPIGPWNGLINSGIHLSWDEQHRPMISYHKYDRQGISQIFIARWETDQWRIVQVSNWPSYTWNINLRGSLNREVYGGAPQLRDDGWLTQTYEHREFGTGFWVIRSEDLRMNLDCQQVLDPSMAQIRQAKYPDMEVNLRTDNTGQYFLRWETLPRNFDRPRDGPLPAPTLLRVYSK